MLRITTLIVLLACFILPAYGQEVPPNVPQSTLDAGKIATQLSEAKAKLESLPAGAEGSAEAAIKEAWQRRNDLLKEATELLAEYQLQETLPKQFEDRQAALAKVKKEQESLPPLPVVASATEDDLAKIAAQISSQQLRVTALRAIESKTAQRADSYAANLASLSKRLETALETTTRLNQSSAGVTEPQQKALLELRLGNAALNADVARLTMQVIERGRNGDKIGAAIETGEREAAEVELKRLQDQQQIYVKARDKALDREARELDQDLKELQTEVDAAVDPAAKFIAEKKLAIADFQRKTREHEKLELVLKADRDDHERRLEAEKAELTNLQDYLKKAGSGEVAGDRLKFTMQRMRLRRQALDRTLSRDVGQELSPSRQRRIKLEDKLFGVKDDWDKEVADTAAKLPNLAGPSFLFEAGKLYNPYRNAMREERDTVTEVINLGQELQVKLVDRGKALAALETFVLSRVFWIRDRKVLGPEIWPRLKAETAAVTTWTKSLRSAETLDGLKSGLMSPGTLVASLFLLFALPLALYWARQRLRRIVTRMNDRTLKTGVRFMDRVATVATSLVSVTLVPACFLIASRVMSAAELSPVIAPPLAEFLHHLAFFLFGRFLSRSFFAGRGTAQVQFGMDRDAAHRLHRALRIGLYGYLVFHFIGAVLGQDPFTLDGRALEVLPRVANTIFLVIVVVAGILLLQPRSAFSRLWANSLGDNFVARSWPFLASLTCITGVGIVGLEIAGYSYGSGVLAHRLAMSIMMLMALSVLFKGTSASIRMIVENRETSDLTGGADQVVAEESAGGPPEENSTPAAAPTAKPQSDAEGATTPGGFEAQFRTFLRVIFIVVGGLIIASIWNLDLQSLQSVYLTETGDPAKDITLSSLFEAVLYLVGAYYLLKSLPGIYEYAIFPKLNFDTGVKYAVLTISRYGIFTVTTLLVISALKIDLSRLQWLMAAIGVGLGFGLQEIVSNFVSGIILLVERPVRVGDTVTIGATSGKVQRINIRATTVVNFDRQEIIVPNRSLITQEVTNWTRGDTIIRLVIPIGVAYGSDVKQVTDLLLAIAMEQPEALTDPAPQVFFLNHGESSLDFSVRVMLPDPGVKMGVMHRMNSEINKRLEALGIEIPFPQRDLHIRSSDVPIGREGSESA